MSTAQPHPVIRYIRKLAGASQPGDPADGQLLERFIKERDENAFATIVERHGPMVLNVCRRLLFDPHEVDDVFQAVFLVLVRKAGSIGKPALLANWLYGVACRTAANARRQTSRRYACMEEIMDMPATESTPDQAWQELRPVLDEELECLAEKYRAPLVLCYLQGRTYTETARILGWAEGTVSGRLARGRELLRARLLRRGLTLSAAALAALLAQNAASATTVPAVLAANTLKAALLVAAGNSLAAGVSTHVAALTEGVLKAMFLTKLKIAAAIVLTIGLLGTGGGALTYNTWAKEKGQEKKDAATAKGKGESKAEIAGNALPPAEAANPAAPAPPVEANRSRQMQDLLAKAINFEGRDDPKTTLSEILDEFATQYNITFDVNERAFESEGLKDVLSAPLVPDGRPLPKMKGVRFSTVLTKVLSRVPSGSGATFVVRRDHIEITTQAAVREELGLHPNAVKMPLVAASFDKSPLEDALKEISTSTGFNIVLDSAKLEKSKAGVTANLNNVPVDTAVRILAEMADMRAVLLDNVLFVTSKETADRLQKEENKRKFRDEEDEKKPEPEKKPVPSQG
jgi:RNA polymerase sigma factor (sigma-70 family)